MAEESTGQSMFVRAQRVGADLVPMDPIGTQALQSPVILVMDVRLPSAVRESSVDVTTVGEESRAVLRQLAPARSVESSEARRGLSGLVREVRLTQRPVLLTRYGRPEAVLLTHATLSRAARLIYQIADAYSRRTVSTADIDHAPKDLAAAIREA